MMSLLRSPSTGTPASCNVWAKCALPSSPCSSASKQAKTTVACSGSGASTRAASRTAETAEPLSSAPGASWIASSTSVMRESRWLDITTVRPVGSSPRSVAITEEITTGRGARFAGSAGWRYSS